MEAFTISFHSQDYFVYTDSVELTDFQDAYIYSVLIKPL